MSQAVHDAAIAMRAHCFPLQQATFANGKSRNALLKGNDVRNSSESNGYSIQITGPSGHEHYMLRHKGRIVGRGDLRQAVAKGAAANASTLRTRNRSIGVREARLRNSTSTSFNQEET